MRIAYDVEETKNVRLSQMLKEESEKRKRMEGVVKNHISREE